MLTLFNIIVESQRLHWSAPNPLPMKPVMRCPSRPAGKGRLRNPVKRPCAPPHALLTCGPSCMCVRVCVMERSRRISVFLNPMFLPWLPFRQTAALQPLIPKRPGFVPSGRVAAMIRAQFATPTVLQSARTLLMWWMEWKGQPLAQSPKGDEIWPPQPGCPENEEVEDLEGNQRAILGAQPFVRLTNSWMHLCVLI